MAEHEGFLHEDEQRALAAGSEDLLRADVMLSVRQLSEELGLSQELAGVLFERVEQRLDSMSEKKQRKAQKAFGKVAAVLTVAPPVHEAPVVEFEAASPATEAEDRLVDLSGLSEEELSVEAEAVVQPDQAEAEPESEPELTPHERIASAWFNDEEDAATLSGHLDPLAKLNPEDDEERQEVMTTLRQRIADQAPLEKTAEFTPQELINLRTLLGWFRSVDGEQRFVKATPLSVMLRGKGFTPAKRKEVTAAVENGLQKLTDAIL